MRLLRVIIFLFVAAFLGLAGYAYLGDMNADPSPMRVEVPLDLGVPAAAPSGPAPATSASATSGPATSEPAAAAPAEPASAAPAAATGGADALD